MSLILAANFIAEKRFEFLGNYFPEVDVQAKLDDVETNYFPDPTIELWGSSRPEGVKLMTAHLLTIDMMNAAQVASMAVNLQAGGGVTFQKLPNIDISGYDATPFGQQYLQLRNTIAASGFSI